jgi:D-alanyl-lipoteichoic acid acyltransferase DltB (MBOAT superfamily)
VLFNSWIFAVFFVVFLAGYALVRRHLFARNVWILLASYFFYGWWSPRFVILLASLAAVDYLAALGVSGLRISNLDRIKAIVFPVITAIGCWAVAGVDSTAFLLSVCALTLLFVASSVLLDVVAGERRKRLWVWASAIANLGTLVYFKYANFFIDTASAALTSMGWTVSPVTLNVILPIGLSFHVFQGLARTVDCYRGVIRPEGSLTTVATYLAFFPQLVAGPIERAAHLIPQFETARPMDYRRMGSGAALFAWGLYMKVVIADNVAPIATAGFGSAATIDGGTAIGAALAFTFQIYCDFCGYSCMAIGLARVLGFDLMANFDQPYFSRTPSEFWKRWHISLSSWLRDYLYRPLGGNREGSWKTYRNLMLTMLLGGLWHGAAWTFVAWGALHGGILIFYRAFRLDELLARTSPASLRGALTHAMAWALMMLVVIAGWVLFRATNFVEAADMFAAPFRSLPYDWSSLAGVWTYAWPLVLVEIGQRTFRKTEVLGSGPFFLRYTAFVLLVVVIMLFGAPPGQDFIYFDF